MEIHGKKSEHTDLPLSPEFPSLICLDRRQASNKNDSSTKLGPELGICGHGAHPDMPRKTVQRWKPFQPNATRNDGILRRSPKKIVTIVAF